jgi:arylsulfatase A-like enzyme
MVFTKGVISHLLAISTALNLLTACTVPPNPTPIPAATFTTAPSPTVTFTPSPTITYTPTGTLTPQPTFTSTATPTFTPTPRPTAKRVIIISFDGLRPEAIFNAPMPNLMALMDQGAFSLQAQTVYPSATLPGHASMLTGLCPAKNGVDWNDYLPEKGYALGTDIFDLAHAAGLQTVMYVGKDKLRQVTEPESTDIFEFINDRDLVIIDHLLANFPQDFGLLFIHFPTADWMGHLYGWLSDEQFSVLRRGDEAVGLLLARLDELGIRDETLIIITADHGGHGLLHGTTRPEDITIPWIIAGPGVEQGGLMTPIYTMDTAATAAWALNLPIPSDWDGVPILEAFGQPALERPLEVCP